MSFRINGFGTALLGISDPDDDGNNSATLWITILYLPVIPLRRQIVRFVKGESGETVYTIAVSERPRLRDVLRTLAFCWIIVPALAAIPALPAFSGIWSSLGLPERFRTPYTIGVIVYELALVLILQNVHERKMKPANDVSE